MRGGGGGGGGEKKKAHLGANPKCGCEETESGGGEQGGVREVEW